MSAASMSALRRINPFTILAGLAALLAARVAVTTVVAVVAAYSAVPYWDQWSGVTVADHWSHLFAQHNEHRIAVPRLFFIVDAWLFAGSNLFNLGSILAIQALHTILLVVLARRSGVLGDGGTAGTVWAAGVVGAFLFWGYQLENFSWGFQVQFVGVYAAATASFAALALRPGTWSGLGLAVLCGGIAVYSMANGVLVPPLLIVLGVWLRLPKRHIAILALAAALLIGSYLWHFIAPIGPSKATGLLGRLDLVAAYALTYLGAPLGHLVAFAGAHMGFDQKALRIPAAMAAGGVGVLLFAVLGLRLMLGAGRAHPARLALLHVMAFVTGTALVTALGRLDAGLLDQAMSQRYGAASVVFWSAAILLSLGLLPAGWPRRWAGPAAVSGVVLLIVATQPSVIREARQVGLIRHEATTALLAGASDAEKLARIYPEPAHLAEPVRRMRDERVSIFAEDWAAWRGTRLADHVRLEAPGACLGSFEAAESIPTPDAPAWRVHGWAWDRNAGKAPSRVLLADDGGVVVGYALTGFPSRATPATPVKVRFNRAGWNGHLRIERTANVTAYALMDEGRAACPLPPARLVESIDVTRVVPAAQAGRAVPMESPAIDGHWAENGFNKAVGSPPVDGPVQASWAGDDAHTGRLRWRSGPLEGARALLVPVVTGPRTEGLALRVVEPGSGRVLARLQLAGFATWQMWEVTLPADGSVAAIEIQAEDNGREWGQWLAVGQPRLPLDGAAP